MLRCSLRFKVQDLRFKTELGIMINDFRFLKWLIVVLVSSYLSQKMPTLFSIGIVYVFLKELSLRLSSRCFFCSRCGSSNFRFLTDRFSTSFANFAFSVFASFSFIGLRFSNAVNLSLDFSLFC